jgi:hypothetical protein
MTDKPDKKGPSDAEATQDKGDDAPKPANPLAALMAAKKAGANDAPIDNMGKAPRRPDGKNSGPAI